MYEYKAIVASIYDGDTIRVDIDLGFSIWMKNESIRLYGLDAPEIRGSERSSGLITRDELIKLIPIGSTITLKTIKDSKEKYGRYLGIIISDTGVNVNDYLLTNQLAIEYIE